MKLTNEIIQTCRRYRECMMEVEGRGKSKALCQKLLILWTSARQVMGIADPALLVALLDAYEVTRDEGMLQEVLDVVSGNIERLEVSVEGVKLLAYCYYYVEEEECLVKAREMLERLKREGKDVREAEQVLEEIYDRTVI